MHHSPHTTSSPTLLNPTTPSSSLVVVTTNSSVFSEVVNSGVFSEVVNGSNFSKAVNGSNFSEAVNGSYFSEGNNASAISKIDIASYLTKGDNVTYISEVPIATAAFTNLPSLSAEVISTPVAPAVTAADLFSLELLRMEFASVHLPGLLVNIAIILVTMAFCELLFRLILKNILLGLFRSLCLDFISGGEAVVISWELITVFHQYGQPLWAVLTYLVLSAKLYRYRLEISPCPYSHLMAVLKGLMTPRDAAARVLAQFSGAFVFMDWQKHVWDWGWTSAHIGRSYWVSYGLCAAWLDVSNEFGFFVEFSGGLLCGLAGSIIFDWELFPAASIHKRIAASTSITLLLVLAAFHKTGGFFQPLLAFARTFGCVGMLRPVSVLDHVLVYWLAASLGAVVAMYTAPYCKMILQKLPGFRKPLKIATLATAEEGKGLLLEEDADDEEDEEEVLYPPGGSRKRTASTSRILAKVMD